MTPVEVDTLLAGLYRAGQDNEARRGSALSTLHRVTGSEVRQRGYGRVSYTRSMSDEQVVEVVTAALVAARAGTYEGPISAYDLLYGAAGRALEVLAGCVVEEARVEAESVPLEAEFARGRWSRFFVVTSSAGHVHSSMGCSTCRVSTRFGWLPELSGRSEGDVVAELGPALCSVCFPSAPVAFQGGRITKAAAEKVSA